MARRLLENALLLDPEAPAGRPGSLLVDAGRIVGRLEAVAHPGIDAERVDMAGRGLAPGLLDLHYHGNLIFAKPEAAHASLLDSSASLVRHGVTGFLATTVSWSPSELTHRMTHLMAALEESSWPGSVPFGIHLEGPWINPAAQGAQPGEGIRAYDAAEAESVFDACRDALRMITFAPEIEGAQALQSRMVGRNHVMAMGHSLATAQEAERAIDRGARHVTHLWNAMSGLHHRAPGLAGTALADDRVTCDIICDGVHVDPRVVRVTTRVKGSELLALISDRIELPSAGDTSFGSGPVIDDGTALRLADGTLAGSRLALDTAIANLQCFTGCSLHEAVRSCTLVPARVLSLESERGTLRPGARADFAVFDAAGSVRETWIAGTPVFQTETAGPTGSR